MILLEPQHRILKDTLTAKIIDDKRDFADVRAADFDDITYRIQSVAESKNLVNVGINVRCLQDLMDNGGKAHLEEVYGDCKVVDNIEGCNFTVQVDLDNLPEDKAGLVNRLSAMKRHVMGSPLAVAFKNFEGGNPGKAFSLPYREGETIYICPAADRVVIVFGMNFKNSTDEEIARVFLQEFAEVRKRFAAAPVVSFNVEPPQELADFNIGKGVNMGYMSMGVEKRHITGDKAASAVDQIQGFRAYFHYHLKCSKAYMHTRMRNRVDSLLQILNRAKPEKPKEEKKTASGRTFTRQ